MPLVFLSYHTDDGAPFVAKLHEDLGAILTQQWDTDSIFRDKPGIKLGERWPDELGAALARADVLLCLFSPRYFRRPWCGKEVAFYQQRLEAYRKQNKLKADPPLILPILWIPELKGGLPFPEAFKSLQWTQDFPPSYTKVGLQQIIKLSSRYAEDYEDILGKIARRILEVIADTPLPPHPGPVDFDTIPDAFAAETRAEAGVPSIRGAALRGPKRVVFFVVAAPRAELSGIRSTVDSYGESGTDWDPFFPPPEQRPIGALAQYVASMPELNLTSEVVVPSDDLIERLKKARADNTLVVFIVDPWTLRIQEYSDRLREYDRMELLNSTVLVAANEGDAETTQFAEILETAIRDTFENKSVDPKRVRWSRVSREQLQQDLREVLVEVRKRIIENGVLKKKVQTDKVFVKPVISAVVKG